MPKQIKIKEINPDVIPIIRTINTKNSNYKILKHSIEQDCQHNPILIRPLTDSEKQNVESHVNYGIIDGHHRYAIAKENHQQTILAEIDTEPPSAYRDMVLALRLNVSNIRMKPVEKGEIIYKILEAKQMNPAIEADIDTIGKDLFGLKTSMTYNCLNLYKKANNIPTIERPRNIDSSTTLLNSIDNFVNVYDYNTYMIKCYHKDLINKPTTKKFNHQLELIRDIQKQLKNYLSVILKYKASVPIEILEQNDAEEGSVNNYTERDEE